MRTEAIVFCCISLLAISGACCAQTTSSETPAVRSMTGVSFTPPNLMFPMPIPGITGEPYSAEGQSERSQTLSDGTHINQESKSIRMFRDSQGRTRIERPRFIGLMRPAPEGLSFIEIRDPLTGFEYRLDVEHKIAHRWKLSRSRPDEAFVGHRVDANSGSSRATTSAPRPRLHPSTGESHPEITSEPLGDEVIEGILSQGTRTTMTFPVGWEGNDRPIVRTCERWMSSELKVMMLSKCSDPRVGDTNMRVVNVDRAEPDPSLFQVPPDYKIEDDKNGIHGYVLAH